MGLIDWISTRIGHDLDESVHGPAGVAHGRFDGLVDEAELIVRARLAGGHGGSIWLRVHGVAPDAPSDHVEAADGSVQATLGVAKPWRGGEVTVEAQVSGTAGATADPLAVLTVEVAQPDAQHAGGAPLVFETYSVEGRLDGQDRAHLQLAVQLG